MKKRALMAALLFLLYALVAVLAMFGAMCVSFHKCSNISKIKAALSTDGCESTVKITQKGITTHVWEAGAGSDGIVHVWEGKE